MLKSTCVKPIVYYLVNVKLSHSLLAPQHLFGTKSQGKTSPLPWRSVFCLLVPKRCFTPLSTTRYTVLWPLRVYNGWDDTGIWRFAKLGEGWDITTWRWPPWSWCGCWSKLWVQLHQRRSGMAFSPNHSCMSRIKFKKNIIEFQKDKGGTKGATLLFAQRGWLPGLRKEADVALTRGKSIRIAILHIVVPFCSPKVHITAKILQSPADKIYCNILLVLLTPPLPLPVGCSML